MNRLWVRMSIAFAGVVIAVSIVAGLMAQIATASGLGNRTEMPPEVRQYLEEARPEFGPFGATTVIIIVGGVAIVAGVWMSRTLTAPMAELGEAAQAIGRQDLSRRVRVRGTDEILALAGRFNEMAAQLEEAEGLRRNLLADVAHELRNPLHVLQGNLQAILDGVYDMSDEEIARIYDQTRHLTAMVDDLHELSQAEAHQLPLNIGATDMAALVKESADVFRPMASSAKIELRVELLGALPQVAADPERLRQVMNNLLNNALRHTPEGGQVLVSVQRRDEMVEVAIRDSGAGIPAEHLDHVFDRFYRTDSARSRERGGAGLGLAIARAIVEEHGGSMKASSPGPDQGSTFTFAIPVAGK
ncbi:MAG: HAMP domain-containing protein [Chloroflexota bacterium]|nr:MAG: HAMP domain-containing protein [Chloroflexota bacterium]